MRQIAGRTGGCACDEGGPTKQDGHSDEVDVVLNTEYKCLDSQKAVPLQRESESKIALSHHLTSSF